MQACYLELLGVVVSLVSGSQLSVSGPAAGLNTLVAASIISLGDFKVFLLAVMVAGFFQIILGILKLRIIANYVPSSVIKGMLAVFGCHSFDNRLQSYKAKTL